MKKNQNLQQYGQASSVTKGKLVKMYYKVLINAIEKAKKSLESKSYDRGSGFLLIAQDCVYELNASLDMSVNSEMANHYRNLYDYLFRGFLEANLKKDPTKLDELLKLSLSLMDLWELTLREQGILLESDYHTGNKLNGIVGKNAIKKRKEIVYKSNLVEKSGRLDLKK